MSTERSFRQIDMLVPPTEPSHLVTKEYYEENLVKPATVILTEPGPLEMNLSYVLQADGDYTLPNDISKGQTIEIQCDCNNARIVVGNNTITRIGAGNNLVMNRNHAITLTASATRELLFTRLTSIGKISGGSDGGSTNKELKWLKLDALNNHLGANGKYMLTEEADYILPLVLEDGDSIHVLSTADNVRILTGDFNIEGVGLGNNLVLAKGDVFELVQSSSFKLELLY